MKFVGAFFKFARRVLAAAKKGGLPSKDLIKLDNLLTRTGKRNTVLAKGILSALSAGGASNNDVGRFGTLLQKAESRIVGGKEPFTSAERKELTGIFQRAYLSMRVARWFATQVESCSDVTQSSQQISRAEAASRYGST